MKCVKSFLPFGLLLFVSLSGINSSVTAANPVRQPDEDVNSPEVRTRAGLRPDEHLLFNGWGVTPAGEQVSTTDLALKLVVAPDGKRLFAVHGGFNQHGVTVFDIATKKETQFLPLKKSWNGLAFSRDGKQFFVSGGDSGQIHVFKYSDGQASFDRSVSPSRAAGDVFLAGIAVQPDTGKLYVCNEANDEIWVLNPQTLALETTIPVGEHPHSCILGADRRNLYVSDWGSRSVSVVDTKKARRVKSIKVGLRPNDMALAPDGRLFVACAGDNTVHVIPTRTVEQSEVEASPTRRISEAAREIISTSIYLNSPEGSTPDAVAVSPDGRTLFIANADNNCVAVVDISNSISEGARKFRESVSVVEGFIPVGWYPSAVAVSPDNQTLFVANGKGLASRPNVPAQTSDPRHMQKGPPFDYIGRTLTGSVSFIPRSIPIRRHPQ
jgi:YVTN family beta-propeller protein